ncbi:Vaccinia kinase 1 [Fasciola hepatica]|uniref:non-specific serine/threonine protein kinase n=1 Tax=Fasciola hepatica TaxID=6192 RepID=A0A4E0RXP9_FASHE|nr:Vaccinia kinase 1 [Fasciola hepatica]
MSVRKRKQQKGTAYALAKPIVNGTVLTDHFKRNFIVGSSIGQGGFGCIYSVRIEGEKQERYVAKIEPQENGPLFTEIHFYIRVCSDDSIKNWKNRHRLHYLGIPRYISSGLFTPPGQARCRYLIMDRFSGDFEAVLKQGRVSAASVVRVASNVIDALEYIHSRDYAHADIKASNLLFETKFEQVYLVDFGLVHLFRLNNIHCAEKPDLKYQHNGTLEFCSRDSHRALAPSRRGDLEILLFNLIHWLARCQPNAIQSPWFGLPWGHLISDPKIRDNVPISVKNQVAAIKEKSALDLNILTSETGIPDNPHLLHFAQTVVKLRYDESPNYDSLKRDLSDLHKYLSSGTARSRHSVSKRRSAESAVTPSASGEQTTQQQTISKEVPVKRSRGRPAAVSKAIGKKPTVATTCVPSSPAPLLRTTTPNRKRTKAAAVTEPSLLPVSTSPTSPRATPTRVTQLKIQPDLKQPSLVSPTRSSPRLNSAALTPVSYQRRPLHLRDLFTDSEDESKKDSFDSRPIKRYPEPSGRKVLSPLNPLKPENERVAIKSQKPIDRRRSACCQTSPELLALAKAEALGRRAAQMANEHFR